jgi:uncharacterized protein YjbJ (UPF0337 family)
MSISTTIAHAAETARGSVKRIVGRLTGSKTKDASGH